MVIDIKNQKEKLSFVCRNSIEEFLALACRSESNEGSGSGFLIMCLRIVGAIVSRD